jgi:hypothetical protein
MAGEKNFNVKNGLSVGGVEVVDSSADLVVGAFGTAAKEAIDDQVNTLLTAGSGVSLSYDDTAGTLTITRDAETGDISSVVAGSGLSGGGTSGDVTLTLDTGTVFSEAVADTVGAMVTTNTESGITVAYDDADNTLDFTVGLLNQSTTGSAATLTTTRTINGVGFNGSADITFGTDSVTEGSSNLYHTAERVADTVGGMVGSNNESGITVTYEDSDNTLDFVVGTLNQSTTGSAATLTTPRNIGGVAFDGSASINLPGVNATGSQDTTGTAADATVLETARTIGGTSFDGSANIAVALAATATALETARTIHGVSFDGTGNIDLSEVVQDTVGAMFSSNTESGITVDYVDGDGTVDFTVGTLNQNTTGNAATVTNGVYTTGAQTVAGVKTFSSAIVSDLTGNVTGNVSGSAGTTTGNAGSATTLATARTIQGVSFDGSANITTMTAGTGVGVSGTAVSIGQAVATTSKPSFAGITLTADSDVTGHITPTADNTYTLGTALKQWKDVYIGPGSLYVNGQQVVSDNSGTITISADANQNVSVQTSGSGDVDLDPTGSGVIGLKGPVQVTAGSNITSTDGNAIAFASSIDVDAIESRSTDTNLTLSANGTGIVTVADALTVTGDLIVSGTTTTVNSETINLADNIIVLNSDFTSGTPSQDTGFSVLRGGSATKSFVWDESEDKWSVGSETLTATTFEGALTGNVTGNVTGTAGSATGNAGTVTNGVYTTGTQTIGGTKTFSSSILGNLTGNVTGNTSGSSGSTTGNAATATALATARTIAVAGDVSGSGSFDGTGNLSITTVVADDSHNHTVANVDGLQGFLDAKYASGSNIVAGTLTTSNASNAGAYVRNVHQSTSAPTSGDGAVGDLWVLYS